MPAPVYVHLTALPNGTQFDVTAAPAEAAKTPNPNTTLTARTSQQRTEQKA
jgi:hypothetical protein